MRSYRMKNILRPLKKTTNFFRNNRGPLNPNLNSLKKSDDQSEHRFKREDEPVVEGDILDAYKVDQVKKIEERKYRVPGVTEDLKDLLRENKLEDTENLDAERIEYPNLTKQEKEQKIIDERGTY